MVRNRNRNQEAIPFGHSAREYEEDIHRSTGRAKHEKRIPRQEKPRHGRCPTSCYVTFAGIVVLGVIYWIYRGYLETRVISPYSSPKVVIQSGLQVSERYWGTYRPGVYFGTSTRHPSTLVTGLMWFVMGQMQNNMLAVRHWCDQADDLPKYGWLAHDGRNFGHQEIVDKFVVVQTDFVKRQGGQHGGDWSARIKVTSKHIKSSSGATVASLLYYVALDPDDAIGSLDPYLGGGPTSVIGVTRGTSDAVGQFQLRVSNTSGTVTHTHHLATKHIGLAFLRETVVRGLRIYEEKGKGRSPNNNEHHIGLAGDLYEGTDSDRKPNLVVYQVTGTCPFEIEVAFESASFVERPDNLEGEAFTREFQHHKANFHANFERKFSLNSHSYKVEEVAFAEAALSNMLGGIGYFYGQSRVQGEHSPDPLPYWKAPLYTAVPSRSFFPRGFLWDEGFHNLLITVWDSEISQDILAHWFDLMNWDGWIPREQILGPEARIRVPDEFVVQRSVNANPPTLLLTLQTMITKLGSNISEEDTDYLSRLWPRLRAWYSWFNVTQVGETAGAYRWRGRDPRTTSELNPKTLTSGLDDYPRSSHPTHDERHLDLRCWMTLASRLMADIANLLGKSGERYEETFRYLSDNQALDSLHWSYSANGYMDYGLHTDTVELRRMAPNSAPIRVITAEQPRMKFIDSFGYVSFFPLFLQILEPASPKLGRVLEDLKQPDLLWTKFGLRSLARNAPLYSKYNTEEDPPYWRGSIWINMNYLAIRALHHYSNTVGPYRSLAGKIYLELRSNVVANVVKEYQRTGYVWEHYNDRSGKGEGCRPFTGWSALVVLMMGETY